MALAMFFGGAWGYLKLLKLPVPADGSSLASNHTALLAIAALAGTAVLAGLLAVVPSISPLASGLPGLLLIAWTALYVVDVRHAVNLIPLRSQAFGAGWEGLLFTGILGAVGVIMVVPLFVPSRWRRPRRGEAETADRGRNALLAEASTDSGPLPDPEPRRDDEPIVGTVLPRRIARQRNTGSFGAATGPMPRAMDPFPPTSDEYRAAGDTSTFGGP